MLGYLITNTAYFAPLAAALVWLIVTNSPQVRRSLKRFSVVYGLTFMVLSSLHFSALDLCGGTAIKGFGNCEGMPDQLAGLFLPLFLLAILGFVVWIPVIISVCAKLEFERTDSENSDT